LAEGLAGDVRKGLFFRGASPLPFGSEIRPVRDLIAYLITGAHPVGVVPADELHA
jgi:nitronate monooxygenase